MVNAGMPQGGMTEAGTGRAWLCFSGEDEHRSCSHSAAQLRTAKALEANSWQSLVINRKAKSKERVLKGLGGMLGKIPL